MDHAGQAPPYREKENPPALNRLDTLPAASMRNKKKGSARVPGR